jgi:hypothetical protein
MAAMQALRNASFLARLVLAWFALAIGVAVASPLVNPQGIELICSGGGMKLLVQGDQDGEPTTGHTLDCPLCASLDAPPAQPQVGVPAIRPTGHALASNPALHIAAVTAPPLPARGPPASPLTT